MHMLKREESTGYLVNWAGRLLVREIEAEIAPLGLTPGHMPIFVALGGGEALSQKELARRASVEQPTMANTLNRMEAAGLIVRTPDPADRRSALIALSPLALEKADEVTAAARRVNARALADMTETERVAFFSLLRRLIATLDRGEV